MARDNLLECFTYAYITCALWSSTDDDGNPLDDGRDTDDIAPRALADMQRDCAAFYAANAAHIHCEGAPQAKGDPTASESEREAAKAGHDFWLTRNGHGTAFGMATGRNPTLTCWTKPHKRRERVTCTLATTA